MSLDELTLDGNEIWGTSREAPSEKSEKQKEVSRRAQVQLQKTQKDEKKAKGDNDDLFLLLAQFIKNPLYEVLIPSITILLQHAYPSRFILTLTALVYPDAAHYLFEKLEKKIPIDRYIRLYTYPERHIFHNDDIHPSLRDWVTLWMTSSQQFLVNNSTSTILTEKLMLLLASPERSRAIESISDIFWYFFSTKNVTLEKDKADTYAHFILTQLEQVLSEYLKSSDPDLRAGEGVDINTLFGI